MSNTELTLSARELYAFLDIPESFKAWWTREKLRLNLQANTDYIDEPRLLIPGVFAQDYIISNRTAYSLQDYELRLKRERGVQGPAVEYRYPYPE